MTDIPTPPTIEDASEGSMATDIAMPETKARKPQRHPLAWINLMLLAIIILTLNYMSCSEYYRRDLTEDQRFTISDQTINTLKAAQIANRDTPVKVIFAFQRSTQNYNRMVSLLEEYARHSNGKLIFECIDPLRQPNRAREIAQLYDLEFKQNQVVVDARPDTSRALKSFEENKNEAANVRIIAGDSFVLYEKSADNRTMRAVALQMEDLLTAALIGATEGLERKLYIAIDKSSMSSDNAGDENSIFLTIERICRARNMQPALLRLSGLASIPEDACGIMIVGTPYDMSESEIKVLQDYWNRPNAGLFVVLDPNAEVPKQLYRFLREQGVRPQNDRVLLKDRKRAYYEINALFADGLNATRSFWNTSTGLEGESISLQLEEDMDMLAERHIHHFPLLKTTPEFYGETKYNKLNPKFDPQEDNAGPLILGAAVQRGNAADVNVAKRTGRMVVLGNIDMLRPQQLKPEQRDFLLSLASWMTNREELAGMGSRHDLTVKLNLDRKAVSVLELICTLCLPLLALLCAFIAWYSRRS